MAAREPYIFISHSRTDNEFTEWLNTALKNAGFNTWFDVDNIPQGSTWVREIEQGVRECGALLVVMSKNARASEWVERETLLAMDLRKPVFAAVVDDVQIPIYLVNRQHSDFRKNRDTAARRLIKALNNISLTEPLPEPVKAREAAKLAPETNETNFFKYLEQLPDGEQNARIARELYQWANKQGATVTFGGWFTPVFHARINVGTSNITVFSIWAYSRQPAAQIPFQYLQVAPPYDEKQLRLSTLDALNRLTGEGENFADEKAERRPNLPMTRLQSAEHIADFKQIIKEIIDNLRDQ